jgi:hypothetical protein
MLFFNTAYVCVLLCVSCMKIQDMIESGMEPQKIADTLLEQAERVREGLPATVEEEKEYFPDEIIIVSRCHSPCHCPCYCHCYCYCAVLSRMPPSYRHH